MNQKIIKHRSNGGWISYTNNGIEHKSYFLKKPFLIPWSNINFLCLTPFVKLDNGIWFTFDGENINGDKSILDLKYLYIDIIIKDYKKLDYGNSILKKVFKHIIHPIFTSLADENGLCHPKEAFYRYPVMRKSLNVPLKELLNFINSNSKFDILTFLD